MVTPFLLNCGVCTALYTISSLPFMLLLFFLFLLDLVLLLLLLLFIFQTPLSFPSHPEPLPPPPPPRPRFPPAPVADQAGLYVYGKILVVFWYP